MDAPTHGQSTPLATPNGQIRIGVGILLGASGALWSLPFLWPRHRLPLVTLDNELLAQASLGAALIAIALIPKARMTVRWPLPALLLLLFALAVWQFASDRLAYGQQLLGVAWFSACMLLAYALGRAIHAAGLVERVVAICCRAAVIAAAVSVALEWLQVLDARALPPWLVFFPDDAACRIRPCGNVAQTNLLATYLGAGALAVLYLRARGLRDRMPAVALFWLACGLGMTGSRMSTLYLLFLTGLLAVPNALRPGSVRARVQLGCALWAGYAGGIAGVLLALGPELSLLARFAQETYGIRLEIYRQAWLIGLQHPLLGSGAGQFAAAQYWVAQAGRYVQPEVNAHNLLLEFGAEFGWPAAGAALCVGMWWGLVDLRARLGRPESAFAWAVLVLLAIHSMLEYPLWYLFYAVIGALLFGLAEPAGGRATSLRTWALAPIGLALLAVGAAAKIDADRFTPAADAFWSRRSANLPLDAATRRAVLALRDDRLFRPQFERMLLSLDTPPNQRGAEYLALSTRVLSRMAQPELITRHIYLLAQAGRVDEAVRHVERLRVFARDRYPELRAVLMVHLPEQDPRLTPLRLALSE